MTTNPPVEFFAVEGKSQTVLRRTFAASIEAVFDAWTVPAVLQRWWGPLDYTVPVCRLQLREGGPYRIVMESSDARRYPMVGTVHDVRSPHGFTMIVNLDEHPADWIEYFRPKGTPLEGVTVEWSYEVTFHEQVRATTVEVLASYPVSRDRDVVIERGGPQGWSQSFWKLDALLAR